MLTAEDNYRIGTNLYGKLKIYFTVDVVVNVVLSTLNNLKSKHCLKRSYNIPLMHYAFIAEQSILKDLNLVLVSMVSSSKRHSNALNAGVNRMRQLGLM